LLSTQSSMITQSPWRDSRWWSDDKTAKNVVYFFTDRETVNTFARFPEHVRAKKEYAKWYEGYQVIISEVSATYGDGKMPGLTLSQSGDS
jgi:hypothetical protein